MLILLVLTKISLFLELRSLFEQFFLILNFLSKSWLKRLLLFPLFVSIFQVKLQLFLWNWIFLFIFIISSHFYLFYHSFWYYLIYLLSAQMVISYSFPSLLLPVSQNLSLSLTSLKHPLIVFYHLFLIFLSHYQSFKQPF